MLKSLKIENFKAFGPAVHVDFAPITLIYGQNSAGKSTILQALNLLKQTHESRESGAPLLTRAEGGIVDLGSFRELIFDHDIDRLLRLCIETTGGKTRFAGAFAKRMLPDNQPLGIELAFARKKRSHEVELSDLSITYGSLQNRVASYRPRYLTEDEARYLRRYSMSLYRGRRLRSRDRSLGVQCRWVTDDSAIWGPIHNAWLAQRVAVRDRLSKMQNEFTRRQHSGFVRDAPEENNPESTEQAGQRTFQESLNFYSEDFSLNDFTKRMTKGWKGLLLALDGFLPVSNRGPSGVPLPEIHALDGWMLPGERGLELPMYDIGAISFMAGRYLEDSLDALFPMGPFRRPPERLYIYTGTSPEDVGYKGDHLPDLLFRRSELVEHANRWLRRLEVGYELSVKPIGDSDSDLFEVRLIDSRRPDNVEVGLSDVGFGLSQILPFIVQSLASTDRILSIEQPEVHLHPRLQADIGDLIAECIKDPFSHQYLIETHSEHLILRFLRLVREKKILPSDLSILFVERGTEGSRVHRLNIDDQGEFIDSWPGGFFPERLREIL